MKAKNAPTLDPDLARRWAANELTVADVAAMLHCAPSTALHLLHAQVGRKTADKRGQRTAARLRRRAVLKAWSAGASTVTIARSVGLSREYVRGIIRASLRTEDRFAGLMIGRCHDCHEPLAGAWLRGPLYCPTCLRAQQQEDGDDG